MQSEVQKGRKLTAKRQMVSPSVSYQLRNLTASQTKFAYVNNNDFPKIIIYNIDYDQQSVPITVKNFDQPIMDFKYLNIWGGWYLVVCCCTFVRVYSEDGQKILFTHNKPLGEDKDNKPQRNSYQGICKVILGSTEEIICIGSSNSEIYFIEKTQQQFKSHLGIIFTKKQLCLNNVASEEDNHSIICCDQTGGLHLFIANKIGDILHVKELQSETHQSPVNCMEVLRRKFKYPELSNLLVCADFLGGIIIYDLDHYHKLFKINSHIRMVTCLICDSQNQCIITGSEDTYLNLWKVKTEEDLTLISSYKVKDSVIVGVALIKPETQKLMITSYDFSEIVILETI